MLNSWWSRLLVYFIAMICCASLAAVAYGVGEHGAVARVSAGVCAAVVLILAQGVWRE